MKEIAIETHGLKKQYGKFVAVNNLDLRVNHGEVFGLLGPNGAGKTTTILMLLGLTEPTSGQVSVLGLNPARQPLKVKSQVGYMPDQVGFYNELTARENLIYIAKLNGIPRSQIKPRIMDVLQRVGLEGVADHRVGTFSRGMQQRLGVADVLIKQPNLIIMDEPTQGLDPEGALEFLETILSLKEEGITMLLSSHLLHQVQEVCDRVGLFHEGRLMMQGSVTELALRILGGAYRIFLEAEGPPEVLVPNLRQLLDVINIKQKNFHGYEIEAKSDLRAEVAQTVIKSGGKLLRLDMETKSLDEIYRHYFKEAEHVNSNRAS